MIGWIRVIIYLVKIEKVGFRGGKRMIKYFEGWVVLVVERGYFFLFLCCFFVFLCCSLCGSVSCYDVDWLLGLGMIGYL